MKNYYKTHGHTTGRKHTRTYRIWAGMLTRCNNPKNFGYKNYGGRGIRVCDEWRLFDNFLKDMGPCPDGLSIDRKDYNGNYCPENCRWADRDQQSRNRRNNIMVEYMGETRCLSEWAKITGVPYDRLRSRIVDRKWLPEFAFNPTPRSQPHKGCGRSRFVEINGVSKNIKDWCLELGIQVNTAYMRINRGMTPIEALTGHMRSTAWAVEGKITLIDWCREHGIGYQKAYELVIRKKINISAALIILKGSKETT